MKEDSLPPAPVDERREQQKRDAARGCLLALVMQGAALLAAGLYLVSRLSGWDRLALSAAVAFGAFTVLTGVIVVLLLILGNTPAQRRLRAQMDDSEPASAENFADGGKIG